MPGQRGNDKVAVTNSECLEVFSIADRAQAEQAVTMLMPEDRRMSSHSYQLAAEYIDTLVCPNLAVWHYLTNVYQMRTNEQGRMRLV